MTSKVIVDYIDNLLGNINQSMTSSRPNNQISVITYKHIERSCYTEKQSSSTGAAVLYSEAWPLGAIHRM